MKWSVACLIPLLVATAALAADTRTFEAPGSRIFAALTIESIECEPAVADRYDDHFALLCGRTDEPFKSLKKSWRKAVRRGSLKSSIRWGGAPWKKSSETERTMYVFSLGTPVALSIDFATGAVVVRWPTSFPGCHEGQEFVWLARTDDVVMPASRQRAHPGFPEAARLKGFGGAVMGSYVVDETGEVIDICVTGVDPGGMGFEEEAVGALRRSKFEPATREGRPLAVAATFLNSFDLSTDGNRVSALARKFFEK